MLSVRGKVVRSIGRLGGGRATCQYSTAHHDKAGDKVPHSAGTGTGHGDHHTGPVTEPLGNQLYIVLGLLSASYVVYAISRKSEDGTVSKISKILDNYSYYHDKWAARNALHTAMMEQAAFDRHLFYNSKTITHVDLKFPETFNTGSPWNVSAGRGWANLDKVVEHYQKLNAVEEERRARVLAAQEKSN